jgi:type IV pilus assembly protein PilM
MLRPDAFRDAVSRAARTGAQKRGTAALVIPDYAARMAVLDFEEFPSSEEDRLALLRFRLKKSVPFHVDDAKLGYSIQLSQPRRIEVLALAIARPILNEYEMVLTGSGLRVGLVVPSCIAALPLYPSSPTALSLVAKLAGKTLSVLLLQGDQVRLLRCLDLAAREEGVEASVTQSVLDMLQQTFAFAEDQIGEQVIRLSFCGFGPEAEMVGTRAEQEFGVPYGVVRSRYGAPTQENAGLLGLLERYAA